MKKVAAMMALVGLAGAAHATVFPEVEANESRATATGALGLIAGDTLTGTTTGSSTTVAGLSSADMWRVGTAAAVPGIYRHRLTITTTGTAGHTGTIRGFGQTAATAGVWDGSTVGAANTTDTAFQTSSTTTTPARMNQWYGFGKAENLYYRVTGGPTTTAAYTVTYSMDPVVAITGPATLSPGPITISTIGQGHSTDTDFWVYDSNFNAIVGYGNDDESTNGGGTGATLQSLMTRNFTAGVYYLAISNFALANNMGSPNDDDFRTGSMLDFADIVANSSTSANLNVTVSIGGTQVAATKAAAYDVVFVRFEVVPAPGAMALVGLGGLVAARRRRA